MPTVRGGCVRSSPNHHPRKRHLPIALFETAGCSVGRAWSYPMWTSPMKRKYENAATATTIPMTNRITKRTLSSAIYCEVPFVRHCRERPTVAVARAMPMMRTAGLGRGPRGNAGIPRALCRGTASRRAVRPDSVDPGRVGASPDRGVAAHPGHPAAVERTVIGASGPPLVTPPFPCRLLYLQRDPLPSPVVGQIWVPLRVVLPSDDVITGVND